jgi:hypothetical protein
MRGSLAFLVLGEYYRNSTAHHPRVRTILEKYISLTSWPNSRPKYLYPLHAASQVSAVVEDPRAGVFALKVLLAPVSVQQPIDIYGPTLGTACGAKTVSLLLLNTDSKKLPPQACDESPVQGTEQLLSGCVVAPFTNCVPQ